MDNDVLINSLLNATSLEALKNQLVPCLQAIGVPYKRLCFNVTQSGTDAPVLDILLNEVGTVITPEYDGVGSYILNWDLNVSDLTKVQLFPPTTASTGILTATVGALRASIQTFDTSGASIDGFLVNSSFEFRFYPGWDA